MLPQVARRMVRLSRTVTAGFASQIAQNTRPTWTVLNQNYHASAAKYDRAVSASAAATKAATKANDPGLAPALPPAHVQQWLEDQTVDQKWLLINESERISHPKLLHFASMMDINMRDKSCVDWLYNKETGVHPASHWILYNEYLPSSELAEDGYNMELQPPQPYVARMWAGGEITFHERCPMIGERMGVTSGHGSAPKHKVGKTGPMIFVDRRRDYFSFDTESCLMTERTTFVYRNAGEAKTSSEPIVNAKGNPNFANPVWTRPINWLNPIALFRYSALTWNSHMIHFDSEYAKHDGHRGVLVHGPLMASLILDYLGFVSQQLAQQHAKDAPATNGPKHSSLSWHIQYQRLYKFTYRALQPLIVGTPVVINAKPADAVVDPALHPEASEKEALKSSVLRTTPQVVRVWISDASNPDVVYMDSEAIFVSPSFLGKESHTIRRPDSMPPVLTLGSSGLTK